MSIIKLKYGCNPHQAPATMSIHLQPTPLTIINGEPGYVNMLDALTSWQLVQDIAKVYHEPVAVTCKHAIPIGAAFAGDLSVLEKKLYGCERPDSTALASAYIRSRSSGGTTSYEYWVAVNEVVDVSLAKLLISDSSLGVIAPGFAPEALEMLYKKRDRKYILIQMDSNFVPTEMEGRDIFGIHLEQKRNTFIPTDKALQHRPTNKKIVPDTTKKDLILALLTVKYAPSDSACAVMNGQVIGVGAGQDSRLPCTQIALERSTLWNLENFRASHTNVTKKKSQDWLKELTGISLAVDGYIPFCDTIDYAASRGVSYIIQSGGSPQDDEIIAACNEYGMTMIFSGYRFFYH